MRRDPRVDARGRADVRTTFARRCSWRRAADRLQVAREDVASVSFTIQGRARGR